MTNGSSRLKSIVRRIVRRRKNGDLRLRFSSSSSTSHERKKINFHKNNSILRYLLVALIIYGSLPLSNRNVSALLLAPSSTTKQLSARADGKQRIDEIRTRQHSSTTQTISKLASSVLGYNDLDDDPVGCWRSNLPSDEYASPLLWESRGDWKAFLKQFDNEEMGDPLWEQVKLEALTQLSTEPEAGPQLYQSILSQGSLVEAIVSIIAHEVQSELITATEIKQLFLDLLTEEDEHSIRCDVIAAAIRSPSVEFAVLAILFHTGLHALVCYRVGHRLWKADRTGLAKYLQSTVSGHYSADIHPACSMGKGIYLCTAAGVVIGETATVGDDVSILHGVTLGGTGKELGDRHPKVQHGVILKDCATVLGNIPVGTGAVVMAKAIVNKPVPPLAIMSGVPAKVVETRTLTREAFRDDLEEHLAFKYLDEWKELRLREEEEKEGSATVSVSSAIKAPKR